MKKFHLIIAAALLVVFCGCATYSNGFEKVTTGNGKVQKYPLPVKFYLKSFQELESSEYPRRVFERQDIRNLREELCRYWPDIFTNSPKNAIQIEFIVTPGAVKSEMTFGEITGAVFSFLTLGLVPAQQNAEQVIPFEVRLEHLSRKWDMKLLRKSRGGLGLFCIFYTRFLLPDLEYNWLEGEWGLQLRLRPEHRKDFWQLFLNELYCFPKEEIIKIHTSQKTKEMQLLE